MIALMELRDFLMLAGLPNSIILYTENEDEIAMYLQSGTVILKAVKKKEKAADGINMAVIAFKDRYLSNAIRIISIEPEKVVEGKEKQIKEEAEAEEPQMPKELAFVKDDEVLQQAKDQEEQPPVEA